MSCAHPEPIDPRVRRTKKLLQDSLRELLHEKPLNSISVQDIAERATVNRATFYAHFEDRQSLLTSVLVADLDQWLRKRLPEDAPFNSENLLVVTEAVFEYLGNVRGNCPKAAQEMEHFFGTTMQEWLYEFVLCWIKNSPGARSTPGHSRETVATVLSWSIFGAAYMWSRGARKQSAKEVSKQLSAVLLAGV